MPTCETDKTWRLWQVETAIACNLDCIMCPWHGVRNVKNHGGIMSQSVWDALRPHLSQVYSIDFSGGGEPLLQPRLAEWVGEAKAAGCETGFLTNGTLLYPDTAEKMVSSGIDWIAISMDGATEDVYESIRRGGSFRKVCDHIHAMATLRNAKVPKMAINFVLMSVNAHELEDMVRLAADLGVDQLNIKQCDVIRGNAGKGFGLFEKKETRDIRGLKKRLSKAKRLAKRLKVEMTQFAFTPDEQPVCGQDPTRSLFICQDGTLSPCINLAYGGPTLFFGKDDYMPTIQYGRAPEDDLLNLWRSDTCRYYRRRFIDRIRAHDAVIFGSAFEPSWPKLQETFQSAKDAMPPAPEGCRVCHYLYNV